MLNFISTIFFTIIVSSVWGQNNLEKKTSSIVEEGKLLYRTEMASWYGTDIFLDKFNGKRENIGGYFSYCEDDLAKCIFFSKSRNPKVIGTITFDITYNLDLAQIDINERGFTTKEEDLFIIRNNVIDEIMKDTIFKTYENTNLNLIPFIANGEKKVFILTGPELNGVVIIGNDYLLTFDNKNKLKNKSQLHRNIIYLEYQKAENEMVAMHTHSNETSEFITSTDICTIMLYERFGNWKQHIVISNNYVSIWDCKIDKLVTITKEAWDKIAKDQKE